MKGREGCFAYLDIKVIGGQDELEESPLIHLNNTIMYKTNLFFHFMYAILSVYSRAPDTLRKSASHVEMSSVLFSLFSSSSGGGGSSWKQKAKIKIVVSQFFKLVDLVVGGPGDHLLQDGSVHIRKRDHFLILANLDG